MSEKVADTNFVSRRSRKIPSFIAMDVLEKAEKLERKGEDIVHLELGEPDFDTPLPVEEAGIKALKAKKTHYTNSLGIYKLREAIANRYQERYGVNLDPEQIIITSGSSPALLLIFSALLNPGEEIIISDPHYSCYPNMIESCGGKPIKVPITEKEGFRYQAQRFAAEISDKTKGILINSPGNPTGVVSPSEDLQRLASLTSISNSNRDNNQPGSAIKGKQVPYLISDEIYHGLVYEGQASSILEFTDRAFVINGFSKLYAMTGWRLGYAILPPEFVRPIQKMQQNFFICASSFAQEAAVTALECEECQRQVEEMKRTYNKRRKALLKGLKEIGFTIKVEPTGAFYVLANAKRFAEDSYKLAFEILEEAGVAVTPGIDFGEKAEGFLRFSYANSLENISEALNRLERYLK